MKNPMIYRELSNTRTKFSSLPNEELNMLIDVMIAQKTSIESSGNRPSKESNELLLGLLLEDVRRNPSRYAK